MHQINQLLLEQKAGLKKNDDARGTYNKDN